jgi:hypothetical protein
MDWLRHPSVARERSRAIAALRNDKYDFRRLKKVVFLCGGQGSTRRDDLRSYFARHVDDAMVFYAEAVWPIIAAAVGSANALEVEERLANLADICIVIVESPGTFAELGAFAMSAPLRKKLLPILDSKHFGAKSFLETGPVRWVDADSNFGPSIWTDLDTILTAISEIEDRFGRLGKSRPGRVEVVAASPKHLLFFVCDLVSVFGPCPAAHVAGAVNEILEIDLPQGEVAFYLALGTAMGLLGNFLSGGVELFYRRLQDGALIAFQRKRHIDLATLRASMLSAMQSCRLCELPLAELARQP